MKESRKRAESVDKDVDIVAGKRVRYPVISEEEDEDDVLDEFLFQEETVKELMKEFEEELKCPNNNGINHSSSITFYPSSSSYVTINGNEESCGPSFSDFSSSVMASIYMGSVGISYLDSHCDEFFSGSMSLPETETSQCFWPESEEVSESGTNGCDVDESDDEWLKRVLSVGPFEFEEEIVNPFELEEKKISEK